MTLRCVTKHYDNAPIKEKCLALSTNSLYTLSYFNKDIMSNIPGCISVLNIQNILDCLPCHDDHSIHTVENLRV